MLQSLPSHLDTWVRAELDGLEFDPDGSHFLQLAQQKFEGGIPLDWVAKMSPLAISTWAAFSDAATAANSVNAFGFRVTDIHKTPDIQDSFRDRWGIDLDYGANQALYPANERTTINLWLLMGQHLALSAPHLTPMTVAKYKRNFRTVYMSGGQQFSPDGGINWRALWGPRMYMMGFDYLNPVYDEGTVSDEYGVNLEQLKQEDFARYMEVGTTLIKLDYACVAKSQAFLVLWNEAAERGAGTKSEITWAHDLNIPVYTVLDEGYTKRDLPLWTLGGIREEEFIFDNFVDALFAMNQNLGDRYLTRDEIEAL